MSAPGSRRVTAAEVARRAGCSTAAVSLYLNGKSKGRLAQPLIERIALAVDELGYVPNRIARNLSLGSSETLAFVFPGPHYSLLGHIVDGVSEALDPGWDLTFHSSDPTSRHGSSLSTARVLANAPDALIVASPSATWVEAAAAVRIPTVLIDAPDPPSEVRSVGFDLEPGVRAMAADLRAAGHRRVAFVAYQADGTSLSSRRAVVERFLGDVGVSLSDLTLELPSIDISTTAAAVASMWPAWHSEGVTAVVCADDRHAWGVLSAARDMGLTVPADLSLVGFNDLAPSALLLPALSAISLPAEAVGEAAGRLLLDPGLDAASRHQTFAAPYVHRGSVGAIPR